MRTVAEYEPRAEECRKIANHMKDPEQKKQLEVMAQAWDLLARTGLKQLKKDPRPHRGRDKIKTGNDNVVLMGNPETILKRPYAEIEKGNQHQLETC